MAAMFNPSQSVSDAVDSRLSVRQFSDEPVDLAQFRVILEKAGRAPSGGNLQPWRLYVVSGAPLAAFKEKMAARIQEVPGGDQPLDYIVYPPGLTAPYRDHRFKVGEDMYALIGIERDNKFGRLMWFARNFRFFDAPLALFCYVDRQMGPPQWSDLGMYLQTLMLLLREAGLDSCAQECWSFHHRSVAQLCSPPDNWMLFCGMAIGHRDPAAPVNSLRSHRAPLEGYCRFID
jgi:nitroreductase